MYKAYFKLNSNPFSPSPPPDFIFQSRELKEALAHFSFALENREAFLLLTGEVGTGKTTAVQSVLRLLPTGTPVAVVNHTTLNPRELLEDIALRFGILGVEGKSKPILLRELEEHFEQQWAEGRQSLLILDEAHLLKPDVLEEVRLLSNLEREGGKLVQICLVGQPELIANLQRPELRQLRQRISVRYSLRPLSEAQTREFVVHRLRVAGSPRPELVFSEESLREIHQVTHGIPREINVIAGQSLLSAFLADSPQVLPGHVSSVHEDYGFEGLRQVKQPARPAQEKLLSPPPVTHLLKPEALVSEPPPPGFARRPIPLPPEHLRPEPRYPEVPGPQAVPVVPPPPLEATRLEREPVTINSLAGLQPKRSSGRGMTWLPWVLLVLAGLFLAWRYWLSPMIQEEPEASPAVQQTQSVEDSEDSGVSPRPAGHSQSPLQSSAALAALDSESHTSPQEPILMESSQAQTEPDPRIAANVHSQFLIASEISEGQYQGLITTQVASIRGQERAHAVLATVISITGLPGVALPSQVGGRQWYRILVGRFTGAEEAEEALRPLIKSRVVTEVMIIPMPARAAGRLAGETP